MEGGVGGVSVLASFLLGQSPRKGNIKFFEGGARLSVPLKKRLKLFTKMKGGGGGGWVRVGWLGCGLYPGGLLGPIRDGLDKGQGRKVVRDGGIVLNRQGQGGRLGDPHRGPRTSACP